MDPAEGGARYGSCFVSSMGHRAGPTEIFINNYRRGILVVVDATPEVCAMADKKKPAEISSAKVIGIGVVLFIVVVVIWYLILK